MCVCCVCVCMMCVCMYVCVCVHLCECECVCVFAYVYVFACVCLRSYERTSLADRVAASALLHHIAGISITNILGAYSCKNLFLSHQSQRDFKNIGHCAR